MVTVFLRGPGGGEGYVALSLSLSLSVLLQSLHTLSLYTHKSFPLSGEQPCYCVNRAM